MVADFYVICSSIGDTNFSSSSTKQWLNYELSRESANFS